MAHNYVGKKFLNKKGECMKRVSQYFVLVTCIVMSQIAFADDQPRDWIPAPPGTVGALLYWNHMSGDSMYGNGRRSSSNINYVGNVVMFRAVTYYELAGMTADFNALVPFGELNLDVGSSKLNASGVGNPGAVFTLWPYNDKENKRSIAVAQYLFFPIGNYSNKGALSLSENWWRVKTEVNFTQGFELFPNHDATAEITGGVDFVTANTDYLDKGYTLTQDPVYSLEGHLTYSVTKDWFVSADYYGHWGGAQSYSSHHDVNYINTQTLGASAGYNLSKQWQLLFSYKGDVYCENGVAAQTFLTRIAYFTNWDALFK